MMYSKSKNVYPLPTSMMLVLSIVRFLERWIKIQEKL